MPEINTIAVFTDYDGMIEAMRARKDELQLTDKAIDELALLPDGYTAKLFGAARIKNVGPQSMGALLDVLCFEAHLVPNLEGLERLARRRAKIENDGKRLRPPPVLARLSSRAINRLMPDVASAMGKLGASKGGHARAAKLSPSRRRMIARKAARCMHAKRKMKKKIKEKLALILT